MGDKISARNFARAQGVPVAPSVMPTGDFDAFRAAAEGIGFPLLIKAAAGGGGKGMKIVRDARELARPGASRQAKRSAISATAAFMPRLGRASPPYRSPGGRRWQRRCRSISSNANVRCSGDTRRSSKSRPRPTCRANLREEICAAAVRLAAAAATSNVGTVEFILGADGRFLFSRDEHATPGRASRHRNDHGARPRAKSSWISPRGGACPSRRRARRQAGTRSNAASARKIPNGTSCRRRGASAISTPRRRPSCGSRTRSTKGRQ